MTRKTVMRTAFALGGSALGVFLYMQWLNLPPTAILRPHVVPSPNGRDALFAVYTHLADREELARAMRYEEHLGIGLNVQRAVVVANAPGLRAARAALALPYWNTASKFTKPGDLEFWDIDTLSNLFAMDAEVKASRGDYAGAVESNLDALEMATFLRQGGGLVAAEHGGELESNATEAIWPEIQRLGESDAAAAARRLERIVARRLPLSSVITEEAQIREAPLLRQLSSRTTLDIANGYVNNPVIVDGNTELPTDNVAAARVIDVYRLLLTRSKREIAADYRNTMDNYAELSKRPFAALVPDRSDILSPVSDVPPFFGPVLSAFGSRCFEDGRMRAETGLLECALALQAYRLKQGEYPASLAALVSAGIVDSIPKDPFAARVGTAFGYRRVDAGKYLLYSVGPDGEDNGGKPVDPDANGLGRGTDERGDWIVGVNVGNPVL